jgi:hypothetical protein
MRRATIFAIAAVLWAAHAIAQEESAPRPTEKKSWFSRVFHRGSSQKAPDYNDPRLRGLLLEIELSPQPVKLSEVRQLETRVILTNVGRRAVELQFRSDQRIEIYLRNTEEKILTKWSDNRAFAEKLGTILINPNEHIEYDETIATRDLTPNKVFIAEVLFPEYPELTVRQKFLTAP